MLSNIYIYIYTDVSLKVNLICHGTYRLENLEDNFEKKDGLARGLIAFVSCVCV